MRIFWIVIAFQFLSNLPVVAQDFEKGLAAYNIGDYATSLAEWVPLAEQGNSNAQYKLGVMHRHGTGVSLDSFEAVTWYLAAARQGHARAQSNLGFMYRTGRGVTQSNLHAYMWYQVANLHGYENARKWLHNIKKKMTEIEIEEADAIAAECMDYLSIACQY